MLNKVLAIVMITVLVSSPLAALAQAPRGGPESARPQAPGQAPFPQPGQIGPGNSLAPPSQDPSLTISRQQAFRLAGDSFPGRVLSVRRDGNNWRVRIDQAGTVFNVYVDGRTGEVNQFPD